MAKEPLNAQKDQLVTMIVDGVEVEHRLELHGACYLTERFLDRPCSFGDRGIEPYRAALTVGPEGIVENMSVPAAVHGGQVDDHCADGITVESTSQDFTALLLRKGTYTLKNSTLNFHTESDGSHVSDFTGYGSVITALDGSKLTLDNVEITSTGVAKPCLFCDSNSDALLKDCRVKVMGGRLYDGYINSADCTKMVAAPWVLGITGNARGLNMMGENSSVTVVDCDMAAAQWGVISTDSGKNMQLVVVDSDLTLLGEAESDDANPYQKRYGSGYGTYIIGGADERFYGVHIRVGTYGAIVRNGTGTYMSSSRNIKVTSPSDGNMIYQGTGKGQGCVIDSDGFGFMSHGPGTLNLLDGTVVNSDSASFLVRAGGLTVNVKDGSELNCGDGVLMQVLDDDDSITGLNLKSELFLTFNTNFYEKAGWPSENGQISTLLPPPPPKQKPPVSEEELAKMVFIKPETFVRFQAENTVLNGDIYNGSGYYGQPAKQLYVTLGGGATLNGTISATETRHIDEFGNQNTHFTSREYYYLGRVENRPYFNGENSTEVVLEAGSVWNIHGEGILTALTVCPGAALHGRIVVDGTEIVPEAGVRYMGDIRVS